MPKENLNEFNKEELEGIFLGSRIDYADANDIFNTVKQHYLSKEINVKFYVAQIIQEDYKVLPKILSTEVDIKKYLQILFGRMQQKEEREEYERKQRILDQLIH